MVTYYRTVDNDLREENSLRKNCWISMINPTPGEILNISTEVGVAVEDLKAALDEEERSRIEIEDDYALILIDTPTVEEKDEEEDEDEEQDWYITIPMGIILLKDYIITVCLQDVPILSSFYECRVKRFNTGWRSRFILQILLQNSSWFIHYLRLIDKESDKMEEKLGDGTMTNEELLQVMALEKALVYFKTSLKGNESVIDRVIKIPNFEKFPEDEDLQEDVVIEHRQAVEMANIYSGVLDNLMSAFSSVVSNNQNQVMKILAAVTIVLSIPTMVSSFYGMNLNPASMPLTDSPFGFLILCIFSLVLSLLVTLILKLMNMF